MDRSDVLTLIAVTYTTDSIGQRIPAESERTVFCQINSVTQSEYFEAGRAGLKAEYRATMNESEYQGEELCEYNNIRYGIYRTYRGRNDLIELYLERKAGLNVQSTMQSE